MKNFLDFSNVFGRELCRFYEDIDKWKSLESSVPVWPKKLCRFYEKLDKWEYLWILDPIWPWQLWRFYEKWKKDLTMKTVTELAKRFPETKTTLLIYEFFMK